jgi:hypothetical protein
MVADYRVYAVSSPRVHLTIGADDATTVSAALGNLEATITQRIAAAQAQGRTVKAAQSTFSDFQKQVTTATGSITGIAAAVLAITPASYPGSRPTLEHARQSLLTARTALVKARADLRQLKADARR